jgi:hypothetical protein
MDIRVRLFKGKQSYSVIPEKCLSLFLCLFYKNLRCTVHYMDETDDKNM